MASPHTINLDESLSVWHSPTPLTVTPADGHDQYGLSTGHRFHRIVQRIEQIGRVCWGTNHVQFIEREERAEDKEEVSITEENLDMEDEEDGMGCDHDEPEDEEDMLFVEPGQERILVWDLLGEGFMKEVAEIGWQILN